MSSFTAISNALVGLLEELAEALVDDDHPANPETGRWLHVHRWGTSQVGLLPAAWLALMPGGGAQDQLRDGCNVTDQLRIGLKIALDPEAEGVGEDMAEMERVIDIAVPLVDRAMNDAWTGFGVELAFRTDIEIGNEQFDSTNALRLLLPLRIDWSHDIPPRTP